MLEFVYLVESSCDVTVDGLGVFKAGEVRTFTLDEARSFRVTRGMHLLQTNVPEGVTVTIVSKEG